MSKQPRSGRVTARQREIMLGLLEANPQLISGRLTCSFSKELSDSLWAEMVKRLNREGPPTKNVLAWKRSLADWKTKVLGKAADVIKEQKKTGGGEIDQKVLDRGLSELDGRLLALAGGWEKVTGNPGLREGGFPLSEDQSAVEFDTSPNNSDIRKSCHLYNNALSQILAYDEEDGFSLSPNNATNGSAASSRPSTSATYVSAPPTIPVSNFAQSVSSFSHPRNSSTDPKRVASPHSQARRSPGFSHPQNSGTNHKRLATPPRHVASPHSQARRSLTPREVPIYDNESPLTAQSPEHFDRGDNRVRGNSRRGSHSNTGRAKARRTGPYDRVLADSAFTTDQFFRNMFEGQTKQTKALEEATAQFKRLADATEERARVESEQTDLLRRFVMCAETFLQRSFHLP